MRTNLNKKRSRNENHGEMSLTSTSTVEHNPMNVLNVVKVKLQSTMQIEEEDDTRRSRAGQEEVKKKSHVREGNGEASGA